MLFVPLVGSSESFLVFIGIITKTGRFDHFHRFSYDLDLFMAYTVGEYDERDRFRHHAFFCGIYACYDYSRLPDLASGETSSFGERYQKTEGFEDDFYRIKIISQNNYLRIWCFLS